MKNPPPVSTATPPANAYVISSAFAQVSVVVETRGAGHSRELFAELGRRYRNIRAMGVGGALGLTDCFSGSDKANDSGEDDSEEREVVDRIRLDSGLAPEEVGVGRDDEEDQSDCESTSSACSGAESYFRLALPTYLEKGRRRSVQYSMTEMAMS